VTRNVLHALLVPSNLTVPPSNAPRASAHVLSTFRAPKKVWVRPSSGSPENQPAMSCSTLRSSRIYLVQERGPRILQVVQPLLSPPSASSKPSQSMRLNCSVHNITLFVVSFRGPMPHADMLVTRLKLRTAARPNLITSTRSLRLFRQIRAFGSVTLINITRLLFSRLFQRGRAFHSTLTTGSRKS
jgi:hypothetical protein